MTPDRKELIEFLRQYTEGEPEIILDAPLNPGKSLRTIDPARQKRLQEVEKKASTCTLCPLSEKRTNVVFGDGPPNARLMFVGEGPGSDEDKQGKPFVGRAGQLLNKILAAMQLKREEVYIGNIVKCRPPENRDPLPSEANICLPYLMEQIDLIQPEVLVALGKVAAVYLLNLGSSVSVKSIREQIHNFRGIPLIVTYHPAALLRYPKYKAPTWKDMQMVMKLLSGETQWEATST